MKTSKKAAKKLKAVEKKVPARKTLPPGEKNVQPRTWRKMCKLTEDALASLEAGNLKEVKAHLEALQAVATCAEAVVNPPAP